MSTYVVWTDSESGLLQIGKPSYNRGRSDEDILSLCISRWHPEGVEGKDYHLVDSSIFDGKDRSDRDSWKLVNGSVKFT